MNHFVTKEITIFYPYGDEVPYELLEASGADPHRLTALHEEPFIRVAKREDDVIGVYLLSRLDQATFQVDALGVEPTFRKRGLGSWLVGHAIGVAESKGGRHVVLPRARYRGQLFARLGFEVRDDRWDLEITPE